MDAARLLSFALVLVSAFAHAVLSLLIKKSGDKQIFCWLYNVFSLIIFLPVPIYYIVKDPQLLSTLPPAILLVGILHYGYLFTFAKAFESGDLSLVYPIIRSAPAFVLVAGFVFLGEKVSLLGGTGVLLTVAGVYVLCMKGSGISSLFSPLAEAVRNESTRFAVVTALITTCYSLTDKVIVTNVPAAFYTYLLHLMVFLYMTPQIAMTTTKESLLAELRDHFKPLMWSGFLDPVGYFLVLAAFTFDKVSYVLGLRQVSIIMAVAMGGLILRESGLRQRMIASAIIFVGVLCISFAK